MLKKQRIEFISSKLNSLYPDTGTSQSQSTFQLLIAVLLSAQCTDERVNKSTLFSL